jgi:transposase
MHDINFTLHDTKISSCFIGQYYLFVTYNKKTTMLPIYFTYSLYEKYKKYGYFKVSDIKNTSFLELLSYLGAISGSIVYIQRLVGALKTGENIKGKECHHCNGDSLDNRPENILVLTPEEHKHYHNNPFWVEYDEELFPSFTISQRLIKTIVKHLYSGATYNYISKKYSVSKSTITKIKKSWYYRYSNNFSHIDSTKSIKKNKFNEKKSEVKPKPTKEKSILLKTSVNPHINKHLSYIQAKQKYNPLRLQLPFFSIPYTNTC